MKAKRQINEKQLDKFMEAYSRALSRALTERPEDYAWPASELPLVLGRMRLALERGSYNHSGHGFKLACKELTIPHTKKAIEWFLA